MSRLTLTATSPEDLIVSTADAVGAMGGTSFELDYTAADRVLADGEEPRPDEPVAWTVRATVRRKTQGRRAVLTTYTATRNTPAGLVGHVDAVSEACVELLDRLGVNVVILDNTPTAPPST